MEASKVGKRRLSSRKGGARPKPYDKPLQLTSEKPGESSCVATSYRESGKENKGAGGPLDKKSEAYKKWLTTGWLSARNVNKDPGFNCQESSQSEPPCYSVKKFPGDKVLIGREDKGYQASIALHKDKRYCCNDCYKWYQNKSVYASKKIHKQRSCKHKKPPRPITPPQEWKFWDIGFSDDSD